MTTQNSGEKARNIILFSLAGLIGLVLAGGWFVENHTAQGRVATAVQAARAKMKRVEEIRWANSPEGIAYFEAEDAREKARAAKAEVEWNNWGPVKWWNGCRYRAVPQPDGSVLLYTCWAAT